MSAVAERVRPKVVKTPRTRELIQFSTLKPVQLTRAKLEELWGMSQKLEDGLRPTSLEAFYAKLADPTTILFEHPEGALYLLTDVVPYHNASVHLYIWKKELLGQREMYREGLRYFFSILKLERMTALIPSTNLLAKNLALKLGFEFEGKFKRWLRRGDKFYDVEVFSLMKENA